MRYADIFARLRKECGKTQAEVADYISKQTGNPCSSKKISHWEQGVSMPPAELFVLLCECYGVRDILETFRSSKQKNRGLEKLNSLGLSRAEEYIAMLSGNPLFADTDDEYYYDRKVRHIRLYRVPVAAGFGEYLDSSDYDDFEVDETVPEGTNYAVKVSGGSMEPRFIDGQVVFVKEQKTLDVGEIGVFSLDGDAFIKKLGYGELISLNPLYEPIEIREHDSLHIFGKILGG